MNDTGITMGNGNGLAMEWHLAFQLLYTLCQAPLLFLLIYTSKLIKVYINKRTRMFCLTAAKSIFATAPTVAVQ